MRVLDLVNVLSPIREAETVSHGAQAARVYNGKVQYLGSTCFVQVENEWCTHKLPDMVLSTLSVLSLLDWLGCFDPTTEVTVQVLKKTVQFICSENGSGILNLPLVDSRDSYARVYDNVDEIVLTPVLTNKYKINISYYEWARKVRALRSVVSHSDKIQPLVRVSASEEAIAFTTDTINGNVVHTFFEPEAALPNNWVGTYDLEALALPIQFIKAPSPGMVADVTPPPEVEISFKDNESKVLSPLMLTYKYGVTVVLAPVWQ